MRLYMCTDPYGQTPSGCEFGIIWSVKYLKFIITVTCLRLHIQMYSIYSIDTWSALVKVQTEGDMDKSVDG